MKFLNEGEKQEISRITSQSLLRHRTEGRSDSFTTVSSSDHNDAGEVRVAVDTEEEGLHGQSSEEGEEIERAEVVTRSGRISRPPFRYYETNALAFLAEDALNDQLGGEAPKLLNSIRTLKGMDRCYALRTQINL